MTLEPAPASHLDDAPLVIQAPRLPVAMRYLMPSLGLAFAAIAGDLFNSGRLGIGTTVWSIALSGLALWGLLFVLKPPRLIADRNGLTWSVATKLVRIPWDDIDEIAVTRRKDVGVVDTPLTRVVAPRAVQSSRLLRAPLIGIRYRNDRAPERDPGKRAHLRGFTGYDLSIPSHFDRSPAAIVEALNARLCVARQT